MFIINHIKLLISKFFLKQIQMKRSPTEQFGLPLPNNTVIIK